MQMQKQKQKQKQIQIQIQNDNKRNIFQREKQTYRDNKSYKENHTIKNNNHFRQPKINIVNPILTMSFPELIQDSSNSIPKPKEQEKQAYKDTVNFECKKSVKEERYGWITLKEGQRNVLPNVVENIEYGYEDNNDFIENVIKVQEMLDINHENYKTHYIELYGESEYNKIYMMTDSHKYYSEDDNDDDMNEDDESE